MNPRHAMGSLVVIAGTALLLAGCGGGSGSASGASAKPSGSSSQTTSAGASTAVKISNFNFSPASLMVKQGAGVTVTNGDSAAQSAERGVSPVRTSDAR